MHSLLITLGQYLSYPFVRYAFIVGIFIAVCTALLGVTLVLRRFSLIGDGLSHVAFGAMAAGTVIGLADEMVFTLLATIACAVLLLRSSSKRRIKADASMAMLSVGALAVGYLLLHIFSRSANVSGDVCSTLFGSTAILTLTKEKVWLCVVLSAVVVLYYILNYHTIFAVTFDEDFAKAAGTKTDLFNLVFAVCIAVIVVLAMNLVGSLLISALIIFPSLSAMRLCNTFFRVTITAVVLSVLCTTVGLIVSILFATPTGATIVAMDMIMFGLCMCLGKKVIHRTDASSIILINCRAFLSCRFFRWINP